MNHFTVKKNGGEVDYQYGEWLKAFNGRLRSPPRDSGAKNNKPSSTWELRRFVSQGVDRPQYVDNPDRSSRSKYGYAMQRDKLEVSVKCSREYGSN